MNRMQSHSWIRGWAAQSISWTGNLSIRHDAVIRIGFARLSYLRHPNAHQWWTSQIWNRLHDRHGHHWRFCVYPKVSEPKNHISVAQFRSPMLLLVIWCFVLWRISIFYIIIIFRTCERVSFIHCATQVWTSVRQPPHSAAFRRVFCCCCNKM